MEKEEFESIISNEQSCVDYLRKRIKSYGMVCPECGSSKFAFDSYNRRWRCKECKKQRNLTSGTIMAFSKFPLKHWIATIHYMATNSAINARGLKDILGVNTPNHVRVMQLRIRSAMSQYLRENKIKGKVTEEDISTINITFGGVTKEYEQLYIDELLYKRHTKDIEDKFEFLLDICLTHMTDVKLLRK